MIHFLKGIVEEVGDDYLALDVNGVGYLVFCSARFLAMVAEGEVLKIHIHTHVREDQFTLFGFANNDELNMFELLIKVNGVGAKMALAILSALSEADILEAILREDSKMFTLANGVGKKLAERIVLELKGKVGSLQKARPTHSAENAAQLAGHVVAPPQAKKPAKSKTSAPEMAAEEGTQPPHGRIAADAIDVISALVNLGYKQHEAQTAIARASKAKPELAGFDMIFKAALQELRSN